MRSRSSLMPSAMRERSPSDSDASPSDWLMNSCAVIGFRVDGFSAETGTSNPTSSSLLWEVSFLRPLWVLAFSALVEGLNMAGRAAGQKKQAAIDAKQAELNARETAGPGV